MYNTWSCRLISIFYSFFGALGNTKSAFKAIDVLIFLSSSLPAGPLLCFHHPVCGPSLGRRHRSYSGLPGLPKPMDTFWAHASLVGFTAWQSDTVLTFILQLNLHFCRPGWFSQQVSSFLVKACYVIEWGHIVVSFKRKGAWGQPLVGQQRVEVFKLYAVHVLMFGGGALWGGPCVRGYCSSEWCNFTLSQTLSRTQQKIKNNLINCEVLHARPLNVLNSLHFSVFSVKWWWSQILHMFTPHFLLWPWQIQLLPASLLLSASTETVLWISRTEILVFQCWTVKQKWALWFLPSVH